MVGMRLGERDESPPTNARLQDERRWQGQTPSCIPLLAVDEWNIDQDGTQVPLQGLRYRVGNPKHLRNAAPGVREHRKCQGVLLHREIVLPRQLR